MERFTCRRCCPPHAFYRQAYAVERTRGTWGDVAALLGSVVAAAFGLTIVTGLLFALLVQA